mgnify:CR=1 FL=1
MKLTANIEIGDKTIGSYPVNEDAHYFWHYKGGDANLGEEPVYTVTADNAGKILCVTVSVDGYAKEITWSADSMVSEIEFEDGILENEGTMTLENEVIPQGFEFVNDGTLNVKGTLEIYGEFTNSGTLTCEESATVIIKDGANLVNKGKLNATVEGNDAKAKFGPNADGQSFIGNFTIAAGSINVEGDLDEGQITVETGKVQISGEINGDVTITVDSVEDANVVFENVTINSSATIRLDGAANLGYTFEGKENYIYGTLVPNTEGEKITMTVTADSKLKAFTGAKISGNVNIVAGEGGEVDLNQAQNPQNVGEDISADKVYGQLESVTIVDTLTPLQTLFGIAA